MKRKLYNFTAAVSLMLCLATVVLWVRSYWFDDNLSYRTRYEVERSLYKLDLRDGVVSLFVNYDGGYAPLGLSWGSERLTWTVRSGFDVGHWRTPSGAITVWISIPHWFLAAVLLVYPVLRFYVARRSRTRVSVKDCYTCGYNLTGNISGTCPECGTLVRERTRREKPPACVSEPRFMLK